MRPSIPTLLTAACLTSSLSAAVIISDTATFSYSEDFDQTSLAGGSFTQGVSITDWYVGPGTAVVDGGFSTPRVFHDGDNFGSYTRDGRPDQFWGVQFQNDTGSSITGFEFEFDLNAAGVAANQGVADLHISYLVSSTAITDITSGTYTSIVGENTLFFTDSLQTDLSYTIPALTLGDSEFLMIRFLVDSDDNGGTDLSVVQSRESFTIDNFSASIPAGGPPPIPEPSFLLTTVTGLGLGLCLLRRR